VLGLVRALCVDVEVLRLRLGQRGEVHAEVAEVQTRDLLVEDLRQKVDTERERARLLELGEAGAELLVVGVEEGDLREHLVGERAAHDEARVARGAAEVHETALGEQDDVAARAEQVAVNTGLDLLVLLGDLLEAGDVDLDVEVADVAHNSIVRHRLEVAGLDDVTVTSGGNEDLANGGGLLHGEDRVAAHGRLQSVDRVNLGHNDAGTHRREGHGAALTDITVASNNGGLTSDHDVGGTLDAVNERLAAAVEVVELRLRHAVVDVDGRDLERAVRHHLVEVVHTGGGLLTETEAVLEQLRVLLVDERGKVTTIVEDEVQLAVVLEGLELLLNAPEVLLVGLALPGEDGHAGRSDGSSGVVLGRVDVAARPGNLSTKEHKRLDEHSRLDGHVQAAGDAGTLQGLGSGVLLAGLHETGHLVLGKLDLLAAEGGKRDVGDLEVLGGSGHCRMIR